MKVGLVHDPVYLEHDTGAHVENAGRLRAIMELLTAQEILPRLVSLAPRKATVEEVALAHAPEHIRRVEAMCRQGGGWLDSDTVVSPRSYEVALYAVGGVLRGLEALVKGEVQAAFCLVRPPGHHASFWRAAGFCLFNNIAIAAKYALKEGWARKVLIVDYDVHHGNGTQDTFYTEPSVLFFSTHQSPLYPGTGSLEETGEREGRGSSINVPLPPGCGDEEVLQAYRQVLVPAARRFRPELLLVSAGYDGHWRDPISGMRLSVRGFARIASTIQDLARELCPGRLLFTLEGGYDPQALAHSVAATLRVLLGEREPPDPLGLPPPMPRPDIAGLLSMVKARHGL